MKLKTIFVNLIIVGYYYSCLIYGLEVKIDDEEVPYPAQKLKSHLRKYVPSKLLEKNDGHHLVIPVKGGYTIEESILNKEKNSKSQAKFMTGESRIYSSLTKLRNNISNKLFSKSVDEENNNNSNNNKEGDDDDAKGTNEKDDFENSEFIPTTISTFMMVIPPTSTVSIEQPIATKLSSKKYWVKEFLKFKHNNVNKQEEELILNQQSFPAHRKFKSNIHNYHDTISENNPDLKKWTKLIIEQDNLESIGQLDSKYDDYNYKQYGRKQPKSAYSKGQGQDQDNDHYYNSNGHYYLSNKKEIELDVEEFIKYLINYEGFKREDLEFLRSSNLDYGLKEIEKELNKIKDLEKENHINIIDIGGEGPEEFSI
ncbi:hypothetical protein DFJ63DRAFT_337063 [Scheffersomyces coipomensis]|uniref:uncharacterized protein n=1 Tax=Scheffersomyces coipomensis TaxID=1788519 RepID=UPI00315D4C5D